jgi:hypothetical protein
MNKEDTLLARAGHSDNTWWITIEVGELSIILHAPLGIEDEESWADIQLEWLRGATSVG